MRTKHLLLLLASLVALVVGGCSGAVGDECAYLSDCESGQSCDVSMPGGYCTVTPCSRGTCPDEAVCVFFPTGDSYCMLICSTDDDCRDGYECTEAFGDLPYCAPEE